MRNLIFTVILLLVFANAQSQWYNNYNTGNDMKAVSFPDNNTGWAVGANNTIVKTTNGGNNWFTQNCGLPFVTNFNSVYFSDNLHGFIVGDPYSGNPVVLKTSNGGSNWQLLTVSAPNYVLSDVVITPNDKYILICGYNPGSGQGIIIRSTDEGATWNTRYNSMGRISRLFMTNPVKGFAGGENLLQTDDKGSTWTIASADCEINDLFFQANKKDGWICTETGKIFTTSDSGATWLEQIQIHGESLKSIIFTDVNNGWVSTSEGKIYKTTNGGEHWTKLITDANTSLNDIVMTSGLIGFAVGLDGVILRTINGGGDIVTDFLEVHNSNLNITLLPNQTVSDTIYIPPRPFEEYMTVVDVDVYIDTVLTSIDGNLIFSLYHAGVSDTIIYKVGGTGSNFIGTKLDDEANRAIEEGHAPFTGVFRPSRLLFQFNNVPLSGDWILNVYQDGPGSDPKILTGVIKSWGMGVTTNNALPGTILGGGNTSVQTPVKYKLHQNYPNPFNPATRIKFDVSESSDVNLTIFDITGRKVANLVNQRLAAGTYEYLWNAAGYTSGIYFYRLSAGNHSETKKMMLIK
ncbi:MAG TPA: YCF48-related protein [Ignavibacteria bacterium]|nr:YCF48-related protein [Ignavibacteria bacterium]